jgi:hypothetical protein
MELKFYKPTKTIYTEQAFGEGFMLELLVKKAKDPVEGRGKVDVFAGYNGTVMAVLPNVAVSKMMAVMVNLMLAETIEYSLLRSLRFDTFESSGERSGLEGEFSLHFDRALEKKL